MKPVARCVPEEQMSDFPTGNKSALLVFGARCGSGEEAPRPSRGGGFQLTEEASSEWRRRSRFFLAPLLPWGRGQGGDPRSGLGEEALVSSRG